MMIIGYYFYKYSPEIIENERKNANNFMEKIIIKYSTVFILKLVSILIICIGIFGIFSFIFKNFKN